MWDIKEIQMYTIPDDFPDPYIPGPLPPANLELSEFFDDTLKATEIIARFGLSFISAI
jgi:hypothetical protein